jgi:hypothetical protein
MRNSALLLASALLFACSPAGGEESVKGGVGSPKLDPNMAKPVKPIVAPDMSVENKTVSPKTLDVKDGVTDKILAPDMIVAPDMNIDPDDIVAPTMVQPTVVLEKDKPIIAPDMIQK